MLCSKIVIDAFDEDVLQDDELYRPDPRPLTQVLSQGEGDIAGPLHIALEDPPHRLNIAEATASHIFFCTDVLFFLSFRVLQSLTLQIVVLVLSSTKGAEIPPALRSLSEDVQDMLMKYIYKGMGMPGWGNVCGSVLLAWHEKLTEVVSTGCTLCVMADRRTI
ncbi:actin-related protein 2/3 complex subunit 5 [Scleroderma yunnanense]